MAGKLFNLNLVGFKDDSTEQSKKVTPEPRPLKKGTFDTNAAINSEGSGDMSSTQYNQI